MDWSLFHFLNSSLRGHGTLAAAIADFAYWSVPVFAAATVALWLADSPGHPPRWKLACASALVAAALGLLVNQAIGHLWFRERPFAAHPNATLLLADRSADPSFPSDHATAAFAIAFTVFFFRRRLGIAFLAAAAALGIARIFIGLHYPGDIAAGAVIGLACAVLVATLGRDILVKPVELASRLTDPLLQPRWRLPGRKTRSP